LFKDESRMVVRAYDSYRQQTIYFGLLTANEHPITGTKHQSASGCQCIPWITWVYCICQIQILL